MNQGKNDLLFYFSIEADRALEESKRVINRLNSVITEYYQLNFKRFCANDIALIEQIYNDGAPPLLKRIVQELTRSLKGTNEIVAKATTESFMRTEEVKALIIHADQCRKGMFFIMPFPFSYMEFDSEGFLLLPPESISRIKDELFTVYIDNDRKREYLRHADSVISGLNALFDIENHVNVNNMSDSPVPLPVYSIGDFLTDFVRNLYVEENRIQYSKEYFASKKL
jgi:hypothetical protein